MLLFYSYVEFKTNNKAIVGQARIYDTQHPKDLLEILYEKHWTYLCICKRKYYITHIGN